MCGALATRCPSASNSAQEKSRRSLMFTDCAVDSSVAPICSAMDMNRFAKISSRTGSAAPCRVRPRCQERAGPGAGRGARPAPGSAAPAVVDDGRRAVLGDDRGPGEPARADAAPGGAAARRARRRRRTSDTAVVARSSVGARRRGEQARAGRRGRRPRRRPPRRSAAGPSRRSRCGGSVASNSAAIAAESARATATGGVGAVVAQVGRRGRLRSARAGRPSRGAPRASPRRDAAASCPQPRLDLGEEAGLDGLFADRGDLGEPDAERGEHPGQRRHQHGGDAEGVRDRAGVLTAGAAERGQRVAR